MNLIHIFRCWYLLQAVSHDNEQPHSCDHLRVVGRRRADLFSFTGLQHQRLERKRREPGSQVGRISECA